MIRFLVRTLISVLASAVGLIVAAAVLDDMTLNGSAFFIAILIFTLVTAIATPFLANVARKSAGPLLGAVALVSTIVGLIVTHWVSDGLSITGLSTWLIAGVIVWLVSLVAALLLPIILVKMGLQSARERRN
ncbi:MAG: hypothetical protein RJA49_1761 [Actinomycetota bacterium]|jgi:uncharacterized membrane protein YvlD (DUF360 family)